LSASSSRVWLKEGLKVACCDGGTLMVGELAAISPAEDRLDDDKICVDDEPGD
jgi:hypothetical protein